MDVGPRPADCLDRGLAVSGVVGTTRKRPRADASWTALISACSSARTGAATRSGGTSTGIATLAGLPSTGAEGAPEARRPVEPLLGANGSSAMVTVIRDECTSHEPASGNAQTRHCSRSGAGWQARGHDAHPSFVGTVFPLVPETCAGAPILRATWVEALPTSAPGGSQAEAGHRGPVTQGAGQLGTGATMG